MSWVYFLAACVQFPTAEAWWWSRERAVSPPPARTAGPFTVQLVEWLVPPPAPVLVTSSSGVDYEDIHKVFSSADSAHGAYRARPLGAGARIHSGAHGALAGGQATAPHRSPDRRPEHDRQQSVGGNATHPPDGMCAGGWVGAGNHAFTCCDQRCDACGQEGCSTSKRFAGSAAKICCTRGIRMARSKTFGPKGEYCR